MKKGLTSIVLATSLVAGTAFGATAPAAKTAAAKKPSAASATTASMTTKKATRSDVIKTTSAAPASVTAGGTSVANTSAADAGIMSRMSATLALDYWGQAIDSPFSGMTPNKDTGADEGRVNLDATALVGYKLADKQSLVAAVAANVPTGPGASPSMYDLQARYIHGSIYKSGNFNLGTMVRYYIPTSSASQSVESLGNIRWYQMASYEIPKSRFSLELTTYIRGYAYRSNQLAAAVSNGQAKHLELYAGPQVNYQISPKVKAWLLFEQFGTSRAGQGMLELASSGDLEPGMTFNLTNRLEFSPFLDIKTHNNVSASTTTINANLTFKAL